MVRYSWLFSASARLDQFGIELLAGDIETLGRSLGVGALADDPLYHFRENSITIDGMPDRNVSAVHPIELTATIAT
jgi:hypothetical protein